MNVATLILGMQTSDHEAIFKMMQNHIKEKRDIEIIRIQPGFHQRKHLTQAILEEAQVKNLLVFIEQSEAMTPDY